LPSEKIVASYRKLIVYYFSGTGNSRNVASWLSKIADERGIEGRVLNIAQINRLSIEPPDPDALLVFVSPIHGFNYPPVMLHFVLRFPKGNNKVLLMSTRGGTLIGKFIVPGISGIAFHLSALVLKLKGYSIRAMFPVDLPSNWISLHPGLNERTVKYLHERNKERVTKFAGKVFSGETVFKGMYDIVQDILVAPISLAYYFIGRFVLAKTFYASGDCDHCDACIKGCPVLAIKKIHNRPYWTFDCESCMKCMSHCPRKAIETAHGLLASVAVVHSIVLVGLFHQYVPVLFAVAKDPAVGFVVKNLLFLGFLALSYRIIHYCMRFRFVERLMVYTSFTKYKFWGRRYRALKD
jgi:ferredoxin